MQKPPISRSLLWGSWAGQVWERTWPEFWPVAALLAALAGLGLIGILPLGPIWLRWFVWAVQTVTIASLLVIGWRRIVWPRRAVVLRAIETASGLEHRPLSQATELPADSPADPVSAAVWSLHRQRLAVSLSRLRAPWPRPIVAQRDPYALRVAAVLILAVGLVVAGPDASERLVRLLLPPAASPRSPPEIAAELWFTPPDYTGLSPLYVEALTPDHAELAVPIGSRLLVQVHGAGSAPILLLDEAQRLLSGSGDKDYALTLMLPKTRRLELRVGGATVLSLPLRMVADAAPQVAWSHPPRRTAHGALDLRYKATDDYGVTKLDLAVTPVDPKTMKPRDADTAQFPAALPTPPVRQVNSELFQDLTASPWAGFPVSLRLVVHDALGQRGETPAVIVVLPERVFHNPVAQAIVAARKSLAQSPDKVGEVAQTLDSLSMQPDAFHDDLRIFLALRVAARQLAGDASTASRQSVGALLWATAIRAEDGASGQAEQDMRSAEKALRDAVARHASAAEIHRLTQAVREAISKYLQAMLQNGQNAGQPNSGEGAGKSVTTAQIEAMLERAEALARAGDQAGADAVMAQLQRLMESLQIGSQQRNAGAQALHDVTELAREQQRQLDRTQQDEKGAQDRKGMPSSAADGGKAQSALRDKLDELSRRFGKSGMPASSDLDRAGKAMSAAAKALGVGARGQAISAQTTAVAALRDAAQSLAKSMQGQSGAGGAERMSEDPLGRRTEDGRSPEGEDIDLPSDATATQSRRILDELRRRQGDLERPQIERDYIDRLLQNF